MTSGLRAVVSTAVVQTALIGFSTLLTPAMLAAQSAAVATAPAPTFAKDVAPILQRSCQRCHRPGSIAPM
jgi:cytochrome c5